MRCRLMICLFVAFCCIQMQLGLAQHIPMEHHDYNYNPYSYGYDVEDSYGNKQWRQEKRVNQNEVHGSYGYRDNNGVYREVVYIADKNGFHANIKTNEPGLAGTKEPAGVKLESTYHNPGPQLAASAPIAVQSSPVVRRRHIAHRGLQTY